MEKNKKRKSGLVAGGLILLCIIFIPAVYGGVKTTDSKEKERRPLLQESQRTVSDMEAEEETEETEETEESAQRTTQQIAKQTTQQAAETKTAEKGEVFPEQKAEYAASKTEEKEEQETETEALSSDNVTREELQKRTQEWQSQSERLNQRLKKAELLLQQLQKEKQLLDKIVEGHADMLERTEKGISVHDADIMRQSLEVNALKAAVGNCILTYQEEDGHFYITYKAGADTVTKKLDYAE